MVKRLGLIAFMHGWLVLEIWVVVIRNGDHGALWLAGLVNAIVLYCNLLRGSSLSIVIYTAWFRDFFILIRETANQ